MVDARGIARAGLLAVGLGVSAAVISAPGSASADSSSAWLSDLIGGLSIPAAAPSTLDLQISIDGFDLFSKTGNEATATSGSGDIAIAYGVGANASATGGVGDFAYAQGSNAFAAAGGSSTDTGANYDTAIDIGNNDAPTVGTQPDGAAAGNADLIGNVSGATGSDDTAIDIGDNTSYNGIGGYDGAFAGGAPMFTESGNGNGDTAIDIGDNSGFDNGSFAVFGNNNYAGDSGSNTGFLEGAYAAAGNGNTALADTSYTTYGQAFAGEGDNNYADVLGPDNSIAVAGGGSHDVSYILDPFGTTASTALSGAGSDGGSGMYDLAAVLFTDGTANATNGDYLYDIVTALGNETGTAAATVSALLAELASLF